MVRLLLLGLLIELWLVLLFLACHLISGWRWLTFRQGHCILEHLRHQIELILGGIHLLVAVGHGSYCRMLCQVRLCHVVACIIVLFVDFFFLRLRVHPKAHLTCCDHRDFFNTNLF